eukprot:TRINITY_DN98344_c0_g1_i1.p1 TRINITY_DN98344_c0_g1~~TRINITY_DN98344_c0_g1_i1.p1  ORF type:complete len:266 (-),score=40.81 TRINITY_DN98344_c0_g1_i1:199-996(-)
MAFDSASSSAFPVAGSSPFQHALAVGMLLVMTGLTAETLDQYCSSNCVASFTSLELQLNECMSACKQEFEELANFIGECTRRCKDDREPHTDMESIDRNRKQCQDHCFPPEFLTFGLNFAGSTIVLVTLGVVFTVRTTCRLSKCSHGPCLFYAWTFYALSIIVFLVGLSEMSVGIHVTFILSVALSIFCEALVEYRAQLLDQNEQPEEGFLTRVFGIEPSIIGQYSVVDASTEDLPEDFPEDLKNYCAEANLPEDVPEASPTKTS